MIGPDYKRLVLAALDAQPLAYQGVRKILQGITWECKDLPAVSFEDLGYGSNKLKQLERNYWNAEEIDRVKTVLKKRAGKSFTSVAVSLRNKSKDARSMGHCMLSLVVARTKGHESIEVQYRSTELGLKFSGDLVFLPVLLAELGVEPQVHRFRFANCFISGVYFPYIARWWKDGPVDFLTQVFKRDPTFFRTSTRFMLRSAYQQDQHFPYSPENVAHKYLWKHLEREEIIDVRNYLETKHKKYGQPLPKLHHTKADYVPRGKRAKAEDDDEG